MRVSMASVEIGAPSTRAEQGRPFARSTELVRSRVRTEREFEPLALATTLAKREASSSLESG
jgi:hypothetical protein